MAVSFSPLHHARPIVLHRVVALVELSEYVCIEND